MARGYGATALRRSRPATAQSSSELKDPMYKYDPPALSPTTKLHTSGVKGGGVDGGEDGGGEGDGGGGEGDGDSWGGGGDGEGGGGDGEGGGGGCATHVLHTKPVIEDGVPISHPCRDPVAPRSPIT